MEALGAFLFGFITGTFLFIVAGYLERVIQAPPEVEEDHADHVD